MKKIFVLFCAALLIQACSVDARKTEPMYNCYALSWHGNHAEGYEINHPSVMTIKTKSMNREEAKQAVKESISMICDTSDKFLCRNKTENSHISYYYAMPDRQSPPSSYFCIPVELDDIWDYAAQRYKYSLEECTATRYVDENIEHEGAVKELFPFDNKGDGASVMN